MAPTPTSCARSSRHSDGTAGGGDALELFGWSSGKVVRVRQNYQKHPKANLIHSRLILSPLLSQTHRLQPTWETSKYCVVIAACIRNLPARCNDDAIQDCCINVAWQSRMFDHQDDDGSFHGSAFSYGLKRWGVSIFSRSPPDPPWFTSSFGSGAPRPSRIINIRTPLRPCSKQRSKEHARLMEFGSCVAVSYQWSWGSREMLGNCCSNSAFTSQTPTSETSAEASKNFQQIAHGCRIALPHGKEFQDDIRCALEEQCLGFESPIFFWRDVTLTSPFDLEIP